MIEFLAALGGPLQKLDRAVDRDAFLIAGDEKRDRALRLAAVGGEIIERGGDKAGDAAFHVDRAAAVEHVAGDFAGERRMRPRRFVAGRHDVGMAGEQQIGLGEADARVKIIDRRGAGLVEHRAVHGKSRLRQQALQKAQRAAFLRRDGAAADKIAGDGDGIGGHAGPVVTARKGAVKSAAALPAGRAGPVRTGSGRRAAAKAELDEENEAQHRERQRDGDRQQAGLIVGAGHFQHRKQIEQGAGAKKRDQKPKRQIAIVGAFQGDGEFRIGVSQIDDGAEPVALNLFGEDMTENLGDGERRYADPESLAADAAVETGEEVCPIHRRGLVPQQFVDAGLGAGLLVDPLDDHRAIKIWRRLAVLARLAGAWCPAPPPNMPAPRLAASRRCRGRRSWSRRR